jgi:flagellar protein FliJ
MAEENVLVRQTRCIVAEKARNAASLETMIIDFEILSCRLAEEIAAEVARTGIKDPRHVAYSPLATAVGLRRSNLLTSAQDAKVRLTAVRRELDEATAKLREVEESLGYWLSESALGEPNERQRQYRQTA